jgi:ABC-type lipoprotein release transport system permease subunit
MITAGSIFLAVFFATAMRSLQLGTYSHLFGNIIESYTGYIQVQSEDFFEDQVVDNAFATSSELESILLEDPNISGTIPRFESFALASSGTRTKGVLVMGIDPEKEAGLSDIRNKLVRFKLSEEALDVLETRGIPDKIMADLDLFKGKSYSGSARLGLDLGLSDRESDEYLPLITEYSGVENNYLSSGREGALIGSALAKYLGLSTGDTIVLLSQGYHGATAAGKYVIEGLITLPAPDLESRVVYLPLDICQTLYAAEGMLTSMALEVENTDDKDIDRTISRLEESLDEKYRVLGWKEMNQTIVQQMQADDVGGQIMIVILYLVIAFGVFGTVLMMTTERRREFGVVISIGMQKTKMAAVMVYEMLYMGIIGILLGLAAATPIVIYLFYRPVTFGGEIAKMMEEYGFDAMLKAKWIDTYYLWQSVIVGIIVLISVAYPVRKILKLKEIKAIRS